jgi:hypothetical protein
MDRPLASTSFEEQDAGSGPVHSSPSLGPMTGAIHNISTRHLHDIGTGIPDDRQFLRSWRRILQDCITQQNGRIIQFLLTDISGEATTDLTRRCTDVLNKYAKSTWNFSSSTRDLALPTSTAATTEWIEREIGISPAVLREYLRKAVRLYANTAQELSAAEGRLEEKLKRLETIVSRINDLMFMEPTAALEVMADPTRLYLDSILSKISIEDDYRELVEQYKRFTTLKGVVSLANFQRPANPTCTICMTKEVNQAVTPCGHTFCDECCRTQMTACYICRVQIRDKIRLFFS